MCTAALLCPSQIPAIAIDMCWICVGCFFRVLDRGVACLRAGMLACVIACLLVCSVACLSICLLLPQLSPTINLVSRRNLPRFRSMCSEPYFQSPCPLRSNEFVPFHVLATAIGICWLPRGCLHCAFQRPVHLFLDCEDRCLHVASSLVSCGARWYPTDLLVLCRMHRFIAFGVCFASAKNVAATRWLSFGICRHHVQ